MNTHVLPEVQVFAPFQPKPPPVGVSDSCELFVGPWKLTLGPNRLLGKSRG